MEHDRLADLAVHGEYRVEGSHRVLEDHRDPVSPNAAHFLIAHFEDIVALEDDLAVDNLAGGRGDQAHEGERGDRLAAAGLADDAERFTRVQVKRDTIHGLDDAVLGEELRLEITDIDERTLSVPIGPLLTPGWRLRYCHTDLPPRIGAMGSPTAANPTTVLPTHEPSSIEARVRYRVTRRDRFIFSSVHVWGAVPPAMAQYTIPRFVRATRVNRAA